MKFARLFDSVFQPPLNSKRCLWNDLNDVDPELWIFLYEELRSKHPIEEIVNLVIENIKSKGSITKRKQADIAILQLIHQPRWAATFCLILYFWFQNINETLIFKLTSNVEHTTTHSNSTTIKSTMANICITPFIQDWIITVNKPTFHPCEERCTFKRKMLVLGDLL